MSAKEGSYNPTSERVCDLLGPNLPVKSMHYLREWHKLKIIKRRAQEEEVRHQTP